MPLILIQMYIKVSHIFDADTYALVLLLYIKGFTTNILFTRYSRYYENWRRYRRESVVHILVLELTDANYASFDDNCDWSRRQKSQTFYGTDAIKAHNGKYIYWNNPLFGSWACQSRLVHVIQSSDQTWRPLLQQAVVQQYKELSIYNWCLTHKPPVWKQRVWDSKRNWVSAVTVYKNVSAFGHDVDSSRNWVRKREK